MQQKQCAAITVVVQTAATAFDHHSTAHTAQQSTHSIAQLQQHWFSTHSWSAWNRLKEVQFGSVVALHSAARRSAFCRLQQDRPLEACLCCSVIKLDLFQGLLLLVKRPDNQCTQ